MLVSPQLQSLVNRALANNRNLRSRLAEVAAAKARYRIQHSAESPTLVVSAQGYLTPVGPDIVYGENYYQAGLNLSDLEVDLFGRLKDLSRAAFEQYLATDAGAQAARDILISETASAAATLAADRSLLAIAAEESASGTRALAITQSLAAAGLSPHSDVEDAGTIAAQARSDVEEETTRVRQDRDALDLLVGQPVSDRDVGFDLDELDAGVTTPSAGLNSAVLLRRPDVQAAEHRLKAQNLQVGAARAALFPSLTMNSTLGFASIALRSLFTGGAAGITLLPSMASPLLGGGARAGLTQAKDERSEALAAYQGAIQTAFRDVSDDLARLETIGRQRQAQDALVAAADRSHALSAVRYKAGTEPFLSTLVAQRTLYDARRTRVAAILADINARLSLLQHLGSTT